MDLDRSNGEASRSFGVPQDDDAHAGACIRFDGFNSSTEVTEDTEVTETKSGASNEPPRALFIRHSSFRVHHYSSPRSGREPRAQEPCARTTRVGAVNVELDVSGRFPVFSGRGRCTPGRFRDVPRAIVCGSEGDVRVFYPKAYIPRNMTSHTASRKCQYMAACFTPL